MNLENLLPHSGIMILLDDILCVNESSIRAKTTIKESPFLQNGKFYSYMLLEIMAQTLGLYRAKNDEKSATKIAFLIGCRKFEICKPYLNLGDEIEIVSELSFQDDSGFGVYDSTVFLNEQIIAKANLSVLNPNSEMFRELKNE